MKTSDWVLPTFLGFCLLVVFIGCRGNDFTLDSELIIRDNSVVQEGDFAGIWGNDYWNRPDEVSQSLYRPLTISWYAFLRMFSAEPSVFNIGNVILHIVNALVRYGLLLFLFRSFEYRRLMAFSVCLLAGVHGAIAEGVFGMVGAAEIIASLFMALSWWTFAVGLESSEGGRRHGLLGVSACCWFAALLSKETAAAFPLVLMTYGLMRRGGGVMTTVTSLVPHVVALGAWVACRLSVLGAFASFGGRHVYEEFTLVERLQSSLAVMGSCYLPSFLWPYSLTPTITHQDVHPPAGFGEAAVLMGLLVWVAAVVWVIRAVMRRRTLNACFGLLFIVTLLPGSNLLVPIGAVGAYRFLYTPFFGIAAGLVLLAARLLESGNKIGRVLAGGLVVLTIVGAGGSVVLSSHWKDSKSLFSHAYELNPNSLWAMKNHSYTSYLSDNTRKDPSDRLLILDRFNGIRGDLARVPSTNRLDPASRLLAFHICVNRAGFFLQSGIVNLSNINDPEDSAALAEKYAAGDPERVFKARMLGAQVMLRRVQLLLQDETRLDDEKDMAFDDAMRQFDRVAEALTDDVSSLDQSNYHHQLFKVLTLRAKTLKDPIQAEQKQKVADAAIARALALDPSHPEIRLFNASQLAKGKRFAAALRELDLVIEADRANIPIFKLAADLSRVLKDVDGWRRNLQECLKRPALTPEAFTLKQQAVKELRGQR